MLHSKVKYPPKAYKCVEPFLGACAQIWFQSESDRDCTVTAVQWHQTKMCPKVHSWKEQNDCLRGWDCFTGNADCADTMVITHHNHPSKGSSSPREWGSASTVHWHSPTRAVDLSCYLAFGSWVIPKYFYNPTPCPMTSFCWNQGDVWNSPKRWGHRMRL